LLEKSHYANSVPIFETVSPGGGCEAATVNRRNLGGAWVRNPFPNNCDTAET
jgi:hypothetical protein